MKLIKILDRKLSKNGNHLQSWGEFECPYCLQIVERWLSNGYNLKSCGCKKKEFLKLRKNHLIHGESKTSLYSVWSTIKQRVFNSKVIGYKDYGGRGITICPEWTESYVEFRDWALSNGYAEGLEIDRIETNGNYEPSNCQWITRTENAQKTRGTKLKPKDIKEMKYLYTTENYTQKELSIKYNISCKHINSILNNRAWKNI